MNQNPSNNDHQPEELYLDGLKGFAEDFADVLDGWIAKGYSKSKVFQLIEELYPDDEPEQTQQGGPEQ